MKQDHFLRQTGEMGYGAPAVKDYDAAADGPLHTHPFAVMLLVLDGEFRLVFENSSMTYLPGDQCELAAGVLHAERAGPQGARVLIAKK